MDKVVAVSRQAGSGGGMAGRLAAQRLGVPFYDKEIIRQAALLSGIHASRFERAGQSGAEGRLYSMAPGAPGGLMLEDSIYLAQRGAMIELASKGPCVIVGRGACEALRGLVPLLRVFIYGDLEKRVQRVLDETQLTAGEAKKRIRETDRKRMAYYSFYEENTRLWAEHFDLCIDSCSLGTEKTVQLILAACG